MTDRPIEQREEITQRANPDEETIQNETVVITSKELSVTGTSSGILKTVVTPEMIRPFQKPLARKNNIKRRRTGRTTILTNTPEKV